MAETLVMADTCIWIDYFNRPGSRVSQHLGELIQDERVALVGPVLAELLSGTRTKEELDLINETLDILPYYEADLNAWKMTAMIMLQLKKHGKTVKLIDALIASLCITNKLRLYSIDKDFDHIAHSFPMLIHYRHGS
ncbi:MAG TPA: PIN domain-containing protein [bacterium]|nr:PIN domain-containing protein [bacterium]